MSEELAIRTTVVQLVETFQRASAKVRDAYGMLTDAEAELAAVFAMGEKSLAIRARAKLTHAWHDWDADPVIKQMERQAWEGIVERLSLRSFMSVAKFAELRRQLEHGELPPITIESIADFAEGFRSAAPDMHKAAVMEVFQWLRPNENSHVHGLKTNTELEVGKKVIVGWAVEETFTGKRFHVSYGNASQQLLALENVLNGLDGKGTVAKGYCSELESAIAKAPVGETPLFRYRCCKNRNLHIEFKRLDLLAKLNSVAGGKTLKPEKGNKSPRGTKVRRPPPERRTAEEMTEKELGFFETPDALADALVDLANIPDGARILEPSAGRGAIARAILRAHPDAYVRCIEIDQENFEYFDAGCFRVDVADFLTMEPDEQFGTIIANPPFHGQRDIDHVRAMLRWLRPGGTLVAVMSSGVRYRNDALSRQFLRDVSAMGGSFVNNPPGSFLESGTAVNTVTLVIHGGAA